MVELGAASEFLSSQLQCNVVYRKQGFDLDKCQWSFRINFFFQLQQILQEISPLTNPFQPLSNQVLEHHIKSKSQLSHLLSHPLQIKPSQTRIKIRHIRLTQKLSYLRNNLPKLRTQLISLLSLHRPTPKHIRNHIQNGQKHLFPNSDWRPDPTVKVPDCLPNLPTPELVDGVQGSVAEHLENADFSEHTPFGTVRGPCYVVSAIGDETTGDWDVAVGENDVVVWSSGSRDRRLPSKGNPRGPGGNGGEARLDRNLRYMNRRRTTAAAERVKNTRLKLSSVKKLSEAISDQNSCSENCQKPLSWWGWMPPLADELCCLPLEAAAATAATAAA
ncbi:hypothetical protein G4B88_014505 [Cannabis sativa]|uniref:Uncharacterized protein n=1 Tax=Cannabis sativa TaxID=3483 RepID=A0A7J6IAL8_CANSA|nr:hypothetical protein G4B88_014505 [Cannabis sativa]